MWDKGLCESVHHDYVESSDLDFCESILTVGVLGIELCENVRHMIMHDCLINSSIEVFYIEL